MDIQEIQETPVWALYEKGRDSHRRCGIYRDTDRNYRFYNGNQWEGAKLGEVEPVQKNFIKPIVKYKVSVIHDNLFAIHYAPRHYDSREGREEAGKLCRLLNNFAAAVWEKDRMDFKGRRLTKDAAINDEAILYVDFDRETMLPVNEIVKKADIYYGNENDDDIQAQPYILIRRRLPVAAARELAVRFGCKEAQKITGDADTFDQSGEAAKQEVDDMVTVVYKLYKREGLVHFSAATRFVTLAQDRCIGLSLYPVAHFNWEEKEGSARGEGEVRYLIPNQIEVNRTEVRRVLTVKYQAFPQKVVDVSKVVNPEALNTVGGTIRTNGQAVEDVHKIVGTLPPAQMSPDVRQLQEDMIRITRDLAGAGDSATGQINPETASGRAILAVQQASQAPMTEQKESYKNFLEDVARIWLEYLTVHCGDVLELEDIQSDPETGEEVVLSVQVSGDALRSLRSTVKIDVTPKGVFDRFAQEQTMENLLVKGLFQAGRVGELEVYANVLDDDAVAPKEKIRQAVAMIRAQQRAIADIQAQAQMLQQETMQELGIRS
ncbi:MAG: hypothetical protein IJB47_07915 [Oscillospiraceae bacterium]|nr:hypothetical protein [Oscillospiraceae bacterium]